jgi:hypothetical protein
MSFSPKSLRLLILIAPIVLLLSIASSGFAQMPDLEVVVGDTTGMSGQQNSVISVFLRNYADTVAGFELWIQLDRPDRVIFKTDSVTLIDTTFYVCMEMSGGQCIDTAIASDYWVNNQWTLGIWRCNHYAPSNPDSCTDSTFDAGYDWFIVDTVDALLGNVDTTGTLISGWEYLQTRSIGGEGFDLKITAFANTLTPPYTKGIGFPQYGTKPLIKIRADIFTIPDTATERTVKMMIQAKTLDNFAFSNEKGKLIGVLTDTIPDTNFYRCDEWYDGTCMAWSRVTEPPYDSLKIDTVLIGYLDTNKVYTGDGSLIILGGRCGDANRDTKLNLLDVSKIINYLYRHGAEPDLFLSNCNGDKKLNLLDVSAIINYLYRQGAALVCNGY